MELEPKRLVIGLTLVFILGVLFAMVNGWYTSATNQQLPLIVYGISFISIMVGASVVLLFAWKLNKMQIHQFLQLLPKEERAVIKILLAHNNAIEQNKLVALSGFTKVQITRILQRLSERGVVEKKQMGYTNLVVLRI